MQAKTAPTILETYNCVEIHDEIPPAKQQLYYSQGVCTTRAIYVSYCYDKQLLNMPIGDQNMEFNL